MTSPLHRRLHAIAVAVVVLIVGGCVSTPQDRSLISMRRADLSLAFSNPALDDPVDPETIVEIARRVVPVEVPVEPSAPSAPRPSRPPVTHPPIEICPEPEPGTVPTETAGLNVSLPVEGFYTRLNEGTITISSGELEFEVPYPPLTIVEVRDVRIVEQPQPLSLGQPTTFVHFEVIEQLAPGFTELSEYRYDETRIALVRREVTNEIGVKTFQPATPVTVLELAPPGTTWQSSGLDTETTVARAVTGTVQANEVVDLCGPRVDSIPTDIEVHDVDVAGAGTYGTDLQQPNVQHWATQFGALIIRDERHATEVVQTDEGALTVSYDVVGTLYDTTPTEAP